MCRVTCYALCGVACPFRFTNTLNVYNYIDYNKEITEWV